MAMKTEAAKALRGYRNEVEAQIAQTEARLAGLRAELERVESALTAIGADGGGVRSATARPRPAEAAGRGAAPARAAAPASRRGQQRVKPEQRQSQIVAALADGPLSVKDVAKRLKLGRSRARTLLSELKQRGVLSSERDGNGPRARELYSLPPGTSRRSSNSSGSSRTQAAKSA
jgi:DNA-binding transcriptional ArsR family regulator